MVNYPLIWSEQVDESHVLEVRKVPAVVEGQVALYDMRSMPPAMVARWERNLSPDSPTAEEKRRWRQEAESYIKNGVVPASDVPTES